MKTKEPKHDSDACYGERRRRLYPSWVIEVPSKPNKPRNHTLSAMLVMKDPHCVYCRNPLTAETAQLDKNDLAGPAIVCGECNDRTTKGGRR